MSRRGRVGGGPMVQVCVLGMLVGRARLHSTDHNHARRPTDPNDAENTNKRPKEEWTELDGGIDSGDTDPRWVEV